MGLHAVHIAASLIRWAATERVARRPIHSQTTMPRQAIGDSLHFRVESQQRQEGAIRVQQLR